MKVDGNQTTESTHPETYVEGQPLIEGSTAKEEPMSLDRATQKKLTRIVKLGTMNEVTRFYETQGMILQVYRESFEKHRDDMVLRHQPFLSQEGRQPNTRNVHQLTVSDGKLKGEIKFEHRKTKVYWDSTSRVWKIDK